MEIYGEIIKFLKESGKCLLIEDSKIIGVILTMEEYELLRSKSQTTSEIILPQSSPVDVHPIGEAMAQEMDFPEASANIDEINLADAESITLEDLGLDELPY